MNYDPATRTTTLDDGRVISDYDKKRFRRRLYVQLGRAGDILNVLPLCLRDYQRSGERPVLMVAEKYATLLAGVSYVDALIWRGDFEDVVPAMVQAESCAQRMGLETVCTQIYGRNLHGLETCSSFIRESWERVPDAPPWGSLPLVFDMRDAAREQAVTSCLLRGDARPYIVLSLNGFSSPYEHAAKVRQMVREAFLHYAIVDISAYMAPRFFDLLGLLEGAACLVAVDSGPLHLAHAVPRLPIVAFITREPSGWHGSAWRPQHVRRYYYDEEPEAVDIHRSIIEAIHAGTPSSNATSPRIYHVWSHFEAKIEDETVRRMEFARRTWQAEYAFAQWVPLEFTEKHAERTSAEVGDPKPVPYFHDVVQVAEVARDDDIIAYTNADVCFAPGLTGWIMDKVPRYGAAFTHRWDFYRPFEVPLRSEAAVRRGEWYPGSDAFFFTAGWWRAHRDEMPDMVIGREFIDEVLRQLIKRTGGVEIHGAIYHEKHASFWEHFGNRTTNPGNLLNAKLARKWFLRTGYGPNDPTWWQIPER